MMEIFNKNKGLLYWLIIALVSSITFLSWVSIDSISIESNRVMSFAGTGEIEAKPDIATITINIEEKGKDQKEAENKMTEKANKVIAKLKEYSIEEKDIQTENIYSNKEYNYTKQPYTLIGYTSSETLKVKIRKTENIEKIKSSLAEFGVNIYGLDWSIDNIEKYKEEAKTKAIKDAKDRAEKMSKELDIKLIKIVDFNESYNDASNMYPVMYKADSISAGAAQNNSVQEGINKVKSNVNITYSIK